MTEFHEPDRPAAESLDADRGGADRADAELGDERHADPPHPPFARSPDDYTDPPGHHRRGPDGPALDVGA